jgi:hypothetical protein
MQICHTLSDANKSKNTAFIQQILNLCSIYENNCAQCFLGIPSNSQYSLKTLQNIIQFLVLWIFFDTQKDIIHNGEQIVIIFHIANL